LTGSGTTAGFQFVGVFQFPSTALSQLIGTPACAASAVALIAQTAMTLFDDILISFPRWIAFPRVCRVHTNSRRSCWNLPAWVDLLKFFVVGRDNLTKMGFLSPIERA
jgi:hypothetical protein